MRVYLIAFALMFVSVCKAQAQKTQDVLFLQNGSEIRGERLPALDSATVRIRTTDGSIWVFTQSEVLKTEVSELYKTKKQVKPTKSGYFNTTSLGVLAGSNSQNGPAASLNMVNGYRISPHFSVGLGVGLESYEVGLAPIFVEGKYYLLNKPFSPFVAIQSGYGVPLSNYKLSNDKSANKGGVMLGATIGFRKYLTDQVGFIMNVGYRYQENHSEQDNWWWGEATSMIRRYHHRMAFQVGFTFN
jgi:hypothetical protein